MKQVQLRAKKHPCINKEAQAYIDLAADLKPFISYSPEISNIPEIISKKDFPSASRQVLVEVLTEQYHGLGVDQNHEIFKQITSLESENTYTVTTGQQIHVALGPLYVLYKILSCIATAEELNKTYPVHHFVPVFWMASEDHDLEEIKGVKVYNSTYDWDREQSGAVGRMSNDGLEKLCGELLDRLDTTDNNTKYLELFKEAYGNSNTFAEATQKIIHELFGKFGLVVLEPDHPKLKSQLQNVIRKDLLEEGHFTGLKSHTEALKKLGYKTQISAQALNFFYLEENARLKIKRAENGVDYLIGEKQLSSDELEKLIQSESENFSPNVAMRPLYQEIVLPNLVYIAGASELRYWLQLKQLFDLNDLAMPMVLLRPSAVILRSKNWEKIDQLDPKHELILGKDNEAVSHLEYAVNQEIESAKKAIDHEKKVLKSLQEQFCKLGLKKFPHGAFKQLEKGIASLENAIANGEVSDGSMSESTSQFLKLKNRFFTTENIQERSEYIANYLDILEEIIDDFRPSAFSDYLSLLITQAPFISKT